MDTDLAITGKPAQFGRGVMQDVSDKLLGQFVACLEQRLAGDPEPEAAAAPTPIAGEAAAPAAAAASIDADAAAECARRPAPPPPPPPQEALDLGEAVLPVLCEDLLEAGTGGRRGARAPAPAAARRSGSRRR